MNNLIEINILVRRAVIMLLNVGICVNLGFVGAAMAQQKPDPAFQK